MFAHAEGGAVVGDAAGVMVAPAEGDGIETCITSSGVTFSSLSSLLLILISFVSNFSFFALD